MDKIRLNVQGVDGDTWRRFHAVALERGRNRRDAVRDAMNQALRLWLENVAPDREAE